MVCLTPIQTFTKDIVLTVLIIILLIYDKYIIPIFKDSVSLIILLSVMVGCTFLQGYVLKHLPLKDCLPYRKGNNILELRKMPEGAIPDQYDYIFIYEKGGVKKQFSPDNLPDSSWAFSERIQKLIAKGINNIPLINEVFHGYVFKIYNCLIALQWSLGHPGRGLDCFCVVPAIGDFRC